MDKAGKSYKFVVTAGSFLFLLLAVWLIGPVSVDIEKYKNEISAALSRNFEKRIRIDGPAFLELSVSNGIRLSASKVYISDTLLSPYEEIIKAEKASFHINLPDLLEAKIEIDDFYVVDAEIRIRIDDASMSWLASLINSPDKQSAINEYVSFVGGLPTFVNIDGVTIINSNLVFENDRGGQKQFFANKAFVFSRDGGVRIYFDGAAEGRHLCFDGFGEDIAHVLSFPWKFSGKGEYGGADFFVEGTFNDKARLVRIDNFAWRAGRTKLIGSLNVSYDGARPKIKGTVNAGYVDVADIGAALKDAAYFDEAGENTNRLFSSAKIRSELMSAVDANIDFFFSKVFLSIAQAEGLSGKLDLTDGRLLVSPLNMNFLGGRIKGQVRLDVSGQVPDVGMFLTMRNMDFSKLIKLWGGTSIISGKGDVDIDLVSKGNSVHAIAGNSNGNLRFVMDGGELDYNETRRLVGSIFDVLLPGAGIFAEGVVNCFAARLSIANGLVKTKGVVLDTPLATVSASGAASLGSELIDLRLVTATKNGSPNLIPTIAIRGDLGHPGIVSEIGASGSGITDMLIGVLGVGEGGFGYANGALTVADVPDGNACLYAIEAKVPENQGEHRSLIDRAAIPIDNILEAISNIFARTVDGIRRRLSN